MFTPRYYQQEAHDAAVAWMLRSTAPCLIEAATGAGKSLLVAMLAQTIRAKSGKSILCLQPSGELTEQNREKYMMTGEPSSILSAAAGGKSTRHPVIFGTPLTVKNHMKALVGKVSLVVVDECLTGDTLIDTEIGCIRIDDPRLKSVKIYCFNEKTGEIELDYPRAVWSNGIRNVSRINTESRSIICTSTHKIYTEGYWTTAGKLSIGQKITLLDSQSCALKRLLRASAAVVKKLALMSLTRFP